MKTLGFDLEPLGESAYVIRNVPGPAWQIAEFLERQSIPGLIEAVASYSTVGIYTDSSVFELSQLAVIKDWHPQVSSGAVHVVPVCYRLGEDLEFVAKSLELTTDEVINSHAHVSYECAAIGFCPGFPYLKTLPPLISGLARRRTPRVRIEPGSVAITGTQTGIYPLVRPGGWNLIGRTPLTIVDVEQGYFPIKAGDTVIFEPIDEVSFEKLKGKRL